MQKVLMCVSILSPFSFTSNAEVINHFWMCISQSTFQITLPFDPKEIGCSTLALNFRQPHNCPILSDAN